MLDTIIASLSLLLVTVVASYILLGKIQDAQTEYLNAQNLVKDITFGFTRQLKRVSNKISGLEENIHDAYVMASEAVKQNQTVPKVISQPDYDAEEIKVRIKEQESALNELRKEIARRL